MLIVSGTQQAFALAADVLLDEGDRVVLEDPHYQGARQVFQAHGAKIVPCPVDDDGIVIAALPRTARVSRWSRRRISFRPARCSVSRAAWICWRGPNATTAG